MSFTSADPFLKYSASISWGQTVGDQVALIATPSISVAFNVKQHDSVTEIHKSYLLLQNHSYFHKPPFSFSFFNKRLIESTEK